MEDSLMDAGKVTELVRKILSDCEGYTMVECYAALSSCKEAAYSQIVNGIEDDLLRRQVRDILDRVDREAG